MGVSVSTANDPHASLETQILSLFSNRHNYLTLLPRSSNEIFELVPGCNHNMQHNYPGIMRMPSEGFGGVGGGIMPPRRSRYGYDGGGGFGGCDPGCSNEVQPYTLCGHCGDVAHPGPCGGGPRGSGSGWGRPQRPRYMRGGDGAHQGNYKFDVGPALAAGMENIADAWRSSQARGGGCGPTCSANDGSFRVRGKVDDKDVDLKLGGTPACPCADDGGCKRNHQRIRSRSRSLRRRERREQRRARDLEEHASRIGSSEDLPRGRTLQRPPSRAPSQAVPPVEANSTVDVNASLAELQKNIESLNKVVNELKKGFGPQDAPDLDVPDRQPFYGPEYMPQRGGPYGPMGMGGMRMPRSRPMMDDFGGMGGFGGGMGDMNMAPGFDPRRSRRRAPVDPGFDLGDDYGQIPADLGLRDGLGIGRDRTGLRGANAGGLGGWEDIADMEEERVPERGFGLDVPTRGSAANRMRNRARNKGRDADLAARIMRQSKIPYETVFEGFDSTKRVPNDDFGLAEDSNQDRNSSKKGSGKKAAVESGSSTPIGDKASQAGCSTRLGSTGKKANST